MRVRLVVLMSMTAFLISWVSSIIYIRYHGGGFSTWLKWNAASMTANWPWWLLLTWAMTFRLS